MYLYRKCEHEYMRQKTNIYAEIDNLKKAIKYTKTLPIGERRKLARVIEVMQQRRAMLIQGAIDMSREQRIRVTLFRNNSTGQWVLAWRGFDKKKHTKAIGSLTTMSREEAESIRRWFEGYLNKTINDDI